jgi:hypothetical protein
MQKETAALIAADFDLPAGDEFVADRANPAVVEGKPFPIGVGRAEYLQAIFGSEGFRHDQRRHLYERAAIGRRNDPAIEKIPMNQRSEVGSQNDRRLARVH